MQAVCLRLDTELMNVWGQFSDECIWDSINQSVQPLQSGFSALGGDLVKKIWNSREKPMSNYIYQKHRFHHWPLAVTFIMTCILLQYIGRVSIIAVSQTELSVSFLHSDSDRQHFHFYASPLQIFSQRYTWIENGAIEGGMDRIRADYRHPGSLGLWLLQTLDGKQEPNLRQSRCLIYRNVAVCVQ